MQRFTFCIIFFIIMYGICEAKIVTKELIEGRDYKIITIEKGDTLWKLAKKHYNNSHMWVNFRSYNDFTDPHWIYPGEKLVVSFVEVERVIKFLKEQRDGVKSQKTEEEERLKQLLLQQEELEKKLRSENQQKYIQQKDKESLQADIDGLKAANKLLASEHNQKIMKLSEQFHGMKQEEELLRLSIAELERKLDTGKDSLQGNGVSGLSEKPEPENESHLLKHFLAFGIVCGIILMNSL
ncbi:LysM peptidoglycan-binding domain-containing protein [Candidatus Desantisbacteria bacterium]|nr:LysM peptidoglycan-binding domain-containing protein [Candidatus Desantisbacteria bacterium]